jgi:hypothetical protein
MIRALFVAVACLVPAIVSAQSAGHLEISGGLNWSGRIEYGSVEAVDKTNGGGSRTVFRSRSHLESAAGWDARVGVMLTRALAAEVSAMTTTRQLVTEISNDVEGASGAPSEAVREYLIEGGLRYAFGRATTRGVQPFLTGGAGYLRHLNDGSTLAETGRSYYAGAGALVRLVQAPRRAIKSVGIRGDIRASITDGGVALDEATHAAPAASLNLFVVF